MKVKKIRQYTKVAKQMQKGISKLVELDDELATRKGYTEPGEIGNRLHKAIGELLEANKKLIELNRKELAKIEKEAHKDEDSKDIDLFDYMMSLAGGFPDESYPDLKDMLEKAKAPEKGLDVAELAAGWMGIKNPDDDAYDEVGEEGNAPDPDETDPNFDPFKWASDYMDKYYQSIGRKKKPSKTIVLIYNNKKK